MLLVVAATTSLNLFAHALLDTGGLLLTASFLGSYQAQDGLDFAKGLAGICISCLPGNQLLSYVVGNHSPIFICAAAMLQQPRVPATGQRQAIEIHIKWREVLAQKRIMLKILSRHTGHSMRKLDAVRVSKLEILSHNLTVLHFQATCSSQFKIFLMQDWQRPLYMQPEDAIEYGVAGKPLSAKVDISNAATSLCLWNGQAMLPILLSQYPQMDQN